jgi:ABC-2 type transport system permease protein
VTQTSGEVFDLGYQHYEGAREGRWRARKALWKSGVRTALGLGRAPQAKILPVLLFVAVIIPAVVLSLVASQSGSEVVPGHSSYYQIVSIILFLFAAIIGPELLCPDRREGVINLYLVRPLTTTDYVAGRWLAFFSITLALVYLGQVVLFLGLMLGTDGPLEYVRDHWLDIPRFLGAGFIVAIFTTTLPMAVSAFTTRRAHAAAFVIGLFIILTAVAGALTEDNSVAGDASKWVALIDIGSVPLHLNDMFFANELSSQTVKLVRELPTVVPIGWYLLLTAGPGFVLWWRYRRMRTGT